MTYEKTASLIKQIIDECSLDERRDIMAAILIYNIETQENQEECEST